MLVPVIETVGVAAYPTPLFVIVKSTIPKSDCSTAAVAAAPTPPPPVIVTNGGVVYPIPAFVNNILSIENNPASCCCYCNSSCIYITNTKWSS